MNSKDDTPAGLTLTGRDTCGFTAVAIVLPVYSPLVEAALIEDTRRVLNSYTTTCR